VKGRSLGVLQQEGVASSFRLARFTFRQNP
jgi:hypothetical protein